MSSSSWIAQRICLIVIDGDHWPCHVPSGSFSRLRQMRPLLQTFRCQKTSPARVKSRADVAATVSKRRRGDGVA